MDDKPGIAADVFKTLSEESIVVDMIVQNISHEGKANISFTVPQSELERCKVVMSRFVGMGAKVNYNLDVAKVSVVGVGMKSHSGVASKAFTTLAKENINILMISTSEIGCVVKIIKELGSTVEYRKRYNLKQISYCYIAELVGEKGVPDLEQDEIDEGFETVWMSIEDALKKVKESKPTIYEGQYMTARDIILIEQAIKILK